jgi:3,4-dihydroxy 2-butanone 4-phosphate synthase/GTP cyclohydrolase II
MGELTVTRMARARIPTAEGEFQLCLYINGQDDKQHLALVIGNVAGQRDVLMRVHSECFTGDVLGSLRCDCGEQLDQAMKLIAKEGSGILIYLRQEGRGIGLLNKLRAYNLQDLGYDTVDANLLLGHQADERDYTIAALMLKDLGVHSVRLLTNNPLKIESLQESGITVTARMPLQSRITAENAAYLLTKVQRMHHLLNLDLFSGVVAGHNNGVEAQYSRSVETTTKVLVHHDDGSEKEYLGSVETTGRVLMNHHNGIEALLERAAGHRQRVGRPFVTLSYAQSVDGSIAARPGKPLALSGFQSLVLTHKLRAVHDAILVGIGTVLADNPRLTVRLVEGKNPQPMVADSHLRLPLDANLLQNGSLPPWVATSEQADEKRQKVLEAAGARVLRLPTNARGQVDLAALLQRLGELGINSLMVEGGARIITSFLSGRLVDHLVLTVAPMLVGGLRAVRGLGQSDRVCLPRLHNLRYQQLEEDLVLWGDPAWEEE